MSRRRDEGGQSAVELALVLPLVALLVLFVLQIGLVVRDQLLVLHAARDAAREAAVTADEAVVTAAARGSTALETDRLAVDMVSRGQPGSTVRVTVRYRSPTRVPLVGRLLADVDLEASASMRVEV